MSEFLIEKEKTKEERSVVRICPKCDGRLIKFGGYDWSVIKGQSYSFTIGRICKRCDILYLDPRFKVCKIIYSKLGATNEN